MQEWWLVKNTGSGWEVVSTSNPKELPYEWKCFGGTSEQFARRMCDGFNQGRDEHGNAIKFR